MRTNHLALWLSCFLKPCARYTVLATGAVVLLGRVLTGPPILLLIFPLLTCALCLWAGRRKQTLPELSPRQMTAFFLVPPAAFWGAFLLFFAVEGGIYVGLPALIMAFALKPVVLLYALLSMVVNGLLSGEAWPAWSMWTILVLLSVPGPLCFWLGWKSANRVQPEQQIGETGD